MLELHAAGEPGWAYGDLIPELRFDRNLDVTVARLGMPRRGGGRRKLAGAAEPLALEAAGEQVNHSPRGLPDSRALRVAQ